MTEFGREYGEGLYALCAEEKIEQSVLQEVRTLKSALHENPDFIRLLGNMTLSKQERVHIVDETFKGHVHEYVLNFLKLLVERGAAHAFAECADAYEAAYNREHGVVEAEVTTAQPLNEDQRKKLIARLESMTGREVTVREKIDPAVLGGVLLQMDGKRYDNTVLHRLKAIKQAMAGE
ncbi:MAG: ATP synthase F1 subunit delta [Clostridia bacterium]|nr:ATP synthase F1 subunit delta [Clostridia bacterium]MBR0406863.1 ATP synthase F1 subunit delta [Clostridia bacterium]